MLTDTIWRFLHVASTTFFGGSLLAMLLVQSLLQRALDDTERKHLARACDAGARLLVNPLSLLGWVSGVSYLFVRHTPFGVGKLMACAPVYVHLMLGFGTLALGFTQMWKGRARKFAAAIDKGETFAQAKGHLTRGWLFGLLAAASMFAAFTIAMVKVPNPPRLHCVAPTAAQP